MTAPKKSIQATLKIAAIYVFALTTAVACSKFEVPKTKIGTANGTGTPPPAAAGVAPTAATVAIEKIETKQMGADEYGQTFVAMSISVRHGKQPISFTVYPQTYPYVQDSAKTSVGTAVYSAEGVCANETCTKFGVLINIADSSNGTDFQLVEIWNLETSKTVPRDRHSPTDFSDVSTAYETLAVEQLNP